MTLISIPNVSEGTRTPVIDGLVQGVKACGTDVLDVHRDGIHNRSVFTCTSELVESMSWLATAAAGAIDLRAHSGVHPRVGALDVCPIVPHHSTMDEAVAVAKEIAEEIGANDIPVYLYGVAAERPEAEELPAIRTGGLRALISRAERGFMPDRGPRIIDPSRGVVCVGAREPLIAFNVWLRDDVTVARDIATALRSTSGGPPGVRALGLDVGSGRSQVSMNLTDPATTGIDDVFAEVERLAKKVGAHVESTEIVGLLEERFLPDANATATRLLKEPGRTIESLIN